MKTYESFLNIFKKDYKINQAIINEINKYGFSLSFRGRMNSDDFHSPKIRINCPETEMLPTPEDIKTPKTGYTIELRFLEDEEILKILPNSSKEDFIFDYLKTNSLEGRTLYIWDYLQEDNNYYKITINKELGQLILSKIDDVHEEYKQEKDLEKFNI